jgi:uncharacterized protein YggE
MKGKLWIVAAMGVALVFVAALAVALGAGRVPAALAQAPAGTPRPGIITVPNVAVTGTAVSPSSAPTTTTTVSATAVGAARGTLPGTITVVGEGKVNIQPDIARVNIGVETIQPTVKEASAQASQTMDSVLAALKAQGIADKDIQTSNFSIYVERISSPDGKATDQLRYHVSNQVAITIRKMDQVSNVLDATIEAGANNIYGVSFSVEDPTKVESQGRQAAVADALRRARELARLNGVELGGVVSVSEVVGNQGGFVANSFRDTATGKGGGGPISPGELELTMQLQITYAIQ